MTIFKDTHFFLTKVILNDFKISIFKSFNRDVFDENAAEVLVGTTSQTQGRNLVG
jgi:hypothetical protein